MLASQVGAAVLVELTVLRELLLGLKEWIWELKLDWLELLVLVVDELFMMELFVFEMYVQKLVPLEQLE